jgi:peptidyl-prolyl cis-trans isomerase B (cyclophilin B)
LELTTDFPALQKAVFQFMQLESQKQMKEDYSRLFAEGKYY